MVGLENAQAWVLAKNTRSQEVASHTSVAIEAEGKLLDLPCEGEGTHKLQNHLFTICHNEAWRVPLWVAYTMHGEELDGPGDRHKSPWIRDVRISRSGQANKRVYTGSGFHKGHLAPAQAYVRTQAAVDGTHIYTNAIPQFGSVNSGAWSKLEAEVRKAAKAGADLWIVTGSLFAPIEARCQKNRPPLRCLTVDTSMRSTLPTNLMREQIAIPSHTFKAVLSSKDGTWSARAFVMPNIPRGAGKFKNYRVRVSELEHMLGVELFPGLPEAVATRIKSRATPLIN
jgi:endonuclease G